jgi:ribosomal protein L39E
MILIVDFNSKSDKERLYKQLKGLKPVPYWIELKIDRDKRSNNQNRYFHGVVLQLLSDHTGYTIEEMKQILKNEFLTYTKDLPNGKSMKFVKSTADLNTKEFEDFLENSRRFAIQTFDVFIPLPNEVIEI